MRPKGQDSRKVAKAYGRYSGSDQSDERRRKERRKKHGVDGAAADAGPGYQREEADGGKYGNPGTIDRVDDESAAAKVDVASAPPSSGRREKLSKP